MANIKLWKRSDMENLRLQDKDIEYLSKKGIRTGDYGYLEVYPEFEFNKGIVLAYDSDVPIVCSENGNGIFSLEESGDRFVNSSVEYFILTFEKFKLYCQKVESMEDEEALQIVNSTIYEMKEIDDKAWSDISNYWPIISQQMIEGNL